MWYSHKHRKPHLLRWGEGHLTKSRTKTLDSYLGKASRINLKLSRDSYYAEGYKKGLKDFVSANVIYKGIKVHQQIKSKLYFTTEAEYSFSSKRVILPELSNEGDTYSFLGQQARYLCQYLQHIGIDQNIGIYIQDVRTMNCPLVHIFDYPGCIENE